MRHDSYSFIFDNYLGNDVGFVNLGTDIGVTSGSESGRWVGVFADMPTGEEYTQRSG